ncbi:M48 family metalloprotease [Vulcanisaeta distributa]|uniref:M48 family metalloprotease n=1 Tax=Vulcanisaeta distributa TaxID=164451 RepID=UPI001FB39CA5|nr:M48 family metalloprotease [Vulcanisaeta distributa]
MRNKQVEVSYVNNEQIYVVSGETSVKRLNKPVVIYNAIVPTGLPVIIITRQYLELLNKEELMAVVKHEYAHILNRDYLSAYIVFIPYMLITFLPITIYLIKYLRIEEISIPILIIIYVYLFLVVIKKQYNIAEREADLHAVKAVGREALKSALYKIRNPKSLLSRFFDTHDPIELRYKINESKLGLAAQVRALIYPLSLITTLLILKYLTLYAFFYTSLTGNIIVMVIFVLTYFVSILAFFIVYGFLVLKLLTTLGYSPPSLARKSLLFYLTFTSLDFAWPVQNLVIYAVNNALAIIGASLILGRPMAKSLLIWVLLALLPSLVIALWIGLYPLIHH